MEIIKTPLTGAYIIKNFFAKDLRGNFTKVFHKNSFLENNLETNFEESFFSVNKKNVIRGMHFQSPPYDHVKLVYSNFGEINDVILDIRKKSPTFGNHFAIKLNSKNNLSIYIPKGFAHGFETLKNNTIVTYLTTTQHSPKSDNGILYNSFNYKWKTETPILSERDLSFLKFKNLKTYF